MPTGFTEVLRDEPNTSFRDFVLRCARAFDYCVRQRDEPLSTPPPEVVEPNNYHLNAMRDSEERLRELKGMTLEHAEATLEAERAAMIAWQAVEDDKQAAFNASVDRMIASVNAWRPPTAEHDGLREFMLEQLRSSRSSFTPPPVAEETAEEWLLKKVGLARDSIAYHAKEWAAEVERCERATRWLRELRASLSTKDP